MSRFSDILCCFFAVRSTTQLASSMIGLWLTLALLVILVVIRHLLFPKQEPTTREGLQQVPNGSMGWPFIGETLGYLTPHKSNSAGTFLHQHCSRYGKIFKSNLFGSPTIVSCDLEFNMFVLQNEGKLFESFYPKPVQDILGKLSIMLVNGDLHRKLRNVATSFISGARSRPDFLICLEKLSISVLDSWEGRDQIHFCKEAKAFTMYLMLKNTLNIEPEEPIAFEILQDFLTFMKGLVSLPIYVPGTAYAKAIKARARLTSKLKEIIEERNAKRSDVANGREDFLDEILEKGKLNMDEIVSVILDLLLAGYETTSGLLALLLYFLHESPHVLHRLKEEHLNLRRQKKEGEPLTMDDYKQMQYTSNVISETLRCGNLVKFVHRKALEDVKFKGYLIPEGWQVLPVFTPTHLDPCLHDNPSLFNPCRWSEDETTGKKVTFFGGGLRLCPGAELAKIETAFFLHHLVLKYRWKMKEDDFPVSYPYLEFKKGLLLEIKAADNKSGCNF